MIAAVATHLVVSTIILALALAAAAWIRPLTARTRHAILIIGMAALALPAPMVTRALERQQIAPMPRLAEAINFTPPEGVGGLKPSAPQVTEVVAAIWIGVAALLLLRWWITTQRLVSTAMRSAAPPPARAVRALDDVRRRLGLHRSIDLIASSTCEAPAVVRVLRPVIILPADGCETLDDEELRSLLCHECAHVARHDNLLGVAEALVCSLFWFNPLVWLAHRRIAAAREAACDERVADAALPAETYVGALAKVCRSLLAPRIPAVSCMANAHLKERIQHLMSYEKLSKTAFSHRTIAVTAMLAVLLAIGGAGVVTAKPIDVSGDRYHLNYTMDKSEDGLLKIRASVTDKETNAAVGGSIVTVKPGERAAMHFANEAGDDQREWTITVEQNDDGSGMLVMRVTRNGVIEQVTERPYAAPIAQPARKYNGAPLSLNLANAEIKDVLSTFGRITGMDVTFGPGIEGQVNVHIVNMPWDQALDEILRENGLTYRLEGKKMHIVKQGP